MVKLEGLDLSKNNISGGIPIEIGNLVELKILVLFENDLSGEYLAVFYIFCMFNYFTALPLEIQLQELSLLK